MENKAHFVPLIQPCKVPYKILLCMYVAKNIHTCKEPLLYNYRYTTMYEVYKILLCIYFERLFIPANIKQRDTTRNKGCSTNTAVTAETL